MTSVQILIHPRCRRCETTFPHRVLSTAPCSECGALDWIETHEPAFELIHQRAVGWYGVQDYENVHPGDELELLIAGKWTTGIAERLDTLGFYVREVAGGLSREYRSFETQGVLWRWPQRDEKGWVGPFSSREAAETVRHDHGPGYLVCGVCGWDAWKTELPAHYQRHHGPGTDCVPSDRAAGRRPIRRIVA